MHKKKILQRKKDFKNKIKRKNNPLMIVNVLMKRRNI
jgi:hypothetical protein